MIDVDVDVFVVIEDVFSDLPSERVAECHRWKNCEKWGQLISSP